MNRVTKRRVKEGVASGLIAGVIFMFAEIVAAAALGQPALTPFPMFASVVVGADAFAELSLAVAVLVGSLVHFVLSAVFGMGYQLIAARLPVETRRSWSRHAFLGAAYGFALWVANFQIIARLAYPWFAQTHAVIQIILHALFFGLPLGLLYVSVHRRSFGAQPLPA